MDISEMILRKNRKWQIRHRVVLLKREFMPYEA